MDVESIVVFGDGSIAINYRCFTMRSYNVQNKRVIDFLHQNGFDYDWNKEERGVEIALIKGENIYLTKEVMEKIHSKNENSTK